MTDGSSTDTRTADVDSGSTPSCRARPGPWSRVRSTAWEIRSRSCPTRSPSGSWAPGAPTPSWPCARSSSPTPPTRIGRPSSSMQSWTPCSTATSTPSSRTAPSSAAPPCTGSCATHGCRPWSSIPDGTVHGIGRLAREPAPWMMRQLRHRDGTCRFPGCDARRFTQAHHVEWWSRGGSTDLDNLVLVCAFHHRLVHEHGWDLTRDADGELTWVRPHDEGSRAGPDAA